MSTDPNTYDRAVMPDRWRCAGIPLAVHTLGHALLLQRLGNPYSGRPAALPSSLQKGGLLQALLVCTRPWNSALGLIDTRREWAWLQLRSLWIAKRGLPESVLDFHAYLSDAWPVIDYWSSPELSNRMMGADAIHIYIDRQRRFGLTLHQALSVPVAVAAWDHALEQERSGAITIHGATANAIFEHYEQLVKAGRLPKAGMVHTRN